MQKSQLTVALAGNPNCGKTTIFNNLTGSRQHVGNYPGVTVEKKEGFRRYRECDLTIVDLPGTYSLTAFSPEEVVARNFIARGNCDVLVSIVDAANLERNLYLTTQLLEIGKPVVLVLNMIDVAESYQITIHDRRLSALLGIPVVRAVGSRGLGMDDLLDTVLSVVEKREYSFAVNYGSHLENSITSLLPLLQAAEDKLKFSKRWLAVKLMENDRDIADSLQDTQDERDAVHAARQIYDALKLKYGYEPEVEITNVRYQFISQVCREVLETTGKELVTLSDKIDRILTNRLLGMPIFFGMMWLVFNLVFTVGEYPKGWLEAGIDLFSQLLAGYLPEGEWKGLLLDGVIGGVGSVVVFLPNILLLFFAIAILEDSGYMARAAFIMDRVMRWVGLHGKSFIPLLVGFGCTVPAVLGTRTLENPRDRLVTMLVAPFMSCSARLPVYTVLVGAFFAQSQAGNVLFAVYMLGVILAICMALVFRRFLFPGEAEPFVMELPPYRMPSPKGILIHMWERSLLYLQKAGTIILAASIIIWFLSNYPQDAPAAERIAHSYVAQVGQFVEPIIRPLGFDWKIGVGLLAGFTAKEVIVSTLATIYSVGSAEASSAVLQSSLAADPGLSPLIGFTLMIFVLVYSPCIATLAAIRRETNSWKWALFSSVYSTVLAWLLACLVYQGGRFLGLG